MSTKTSTAALSATGDRRTLERLRSLSRRATGRASGPAFATTRLEELFFRYRARNFPDTLNDAEQARWQQHCQWRACTTAWAAA
jgi:exodeoxyribonuclease-1